MQLINQDFYVLNLVFTFLTLEHQTHKAALLVIYNNKPKSQYLNCAKTFY